MNTPSTRGAVAPAPDRRPCAAAGLKTVAPLPELAIVQERIAPAVDDAEDNGAVLDCERLDVYRVAVEFQAVAVALGRCGDGHLRDQLRRASLSIPLNIAEGTAQWSRRQRRRYYRIALGSASEAAAIVDVLRACSRVDPLAGRRARGLLVRVIQMLTKLDRSLS